MVAGAMSPFLPDRRMRASRVPKSTPPSVAITVSATLKMKPLSTKLRSSSQLMKDQSMSNSISVPSPAGGDHARHARALLDEGHDAVDGQGRHHVQRRHHQVHLDAARGLLLHLHGV